MSGPKREFIVLMAILTMMCILLLYYNVPIGLLALVAVVTLVAIQEWQEKETTTRQEEEQESITRQVKKINRDKMYDMPIPMVVIERDGTCIMLNRAFLLAFGKELGRKGTNIFQKLRIKEKEMLNGNIKEITFENKTYAMMISGFVKNQKQLYLLHFMDITKEKTLAEKYSHSETVFCYIILDNYDDIIEQMAAHERSILLGRIDVILTEWANRNGAIIIKYENDHYLIIFARKNMGIMERCHFHILDEVREAGEQENIQVSLSMGIGVSEEPQTVQEADALSHAALDIALARGGDQCVVREDDKNAYYGGKTEAKEKRTKVKARVKAHGLKEMIENAQNVIIMGHQTPDMDCLGSAVGLMGACRCLGKESRFILQEINTSISSLMDYLSRDKNYLNNFIKPKEVASLTTEGTLLIVVDTQSQSYVEVPQLVDHVENIVVIDHHRASGKSIAGTIFSYLEAYASSTCELVTELLQYFGNKEIIGVTEANALLSGMCMDTKMFTVKTGVRTFEAASYLKRKGADTVIAKTLLQNDIETYAAKSVAVTNAEFYDNTIAISLYENNTENAKLVSAQAADELLNIKGINASFIILKYKGGIFISGRSMGDISVQLILEKLGGGGHLTMAGAQLHDVDDLQEARTLLVSSIETYKKESDKN